MTLRFTKALRAVLITAQAEATKLHSPSVSLAHLLLGVLLSRARKARVLTQDLTTTQREVLRKTLREVGSGPDAGVAEIEFSEDVERALNAAMKMAQARRSRYVGVGELLLAMLDLEEHPTIALARETGLRRDYVAQRYKHGPSEREAYAQGLRSAVKHVPLAERVHPGVTRGEILLVVDLDAVPAHLLGRLMGDMDALHRALGGRGLRMKGGEFGVLADREAYA